MPPALSHLNYLLRANIYSMPSVVFARANILARNYDKTNMHISSCGKFASSAKDKY